MKSDYTEVQVKIIDAARNLFVKNGLKGTTIRDIAAEAGVNLAMVNYYFRSKEKLFDVIFEEAFSILADKVFHLMDSDLPFFELIRKWIYAYYDTLLAYPDFPNFVLTGFAASPRKLAEKFRSIKPYDLFEKLTQLIHEEETKGTIHPVPIPDFVLNIVSLSIFPFAVKPVATQFLNMPDAYYLEFVNKHREYVADFVIKAIKKEN